MILSELLEATQNTNDHTKLLGILSSVSPEIDPPKLSFVSGLSLEEVERVSGENDTLISTKTGLLGAGCGTQLLQSDPYDLDLLARDLEGYRKSITGLTNCLLEVIFDGRDLDTLSTITSIFDTYNQLKTRNTRFVF